MDVKLFFEFQLVVIFLLVISLLLACVLYFLSFLMRYKIKNINKIRAFESGFRVVKSVHSRFSIHFFLILLMFVIFDLEIVLLLGCLLRINPGAFVLFIILIIGGVYLE